MRTVITGGAGFIGSHLCERFLARGHEVICVDNLITGSLSNIDHLRGDGSFRFIHHNISDPLLIDGPVDNVLHFASPASPVDYLRHPIPTLKVGSLGTHNTLGLAKLKQARFLLASTSEVYGDPEVHPQREEYWGNVNPVGVRGCFAADTEVLTSDGWKPFPQVTDRDEILTRAANGVMEYHRPIEVIKQRYVGELIRFANAKIDLLVTPNHKMFVREKGRQEFRLVEAYQAITWNRAEMLKSGRWLAEEQDHFRLPRVANAKARQQTVFAMDLWLEFFGYFITEGSTYLRHRTSVVGGKTYATKEYIVLISQSKKNAAQRRKIRDCLKRLGFTFHEENAQFRITNKQLFTYLRQFGKARQKFVPRDFLRLPPRQLRILLDAMMLGDGTMEGRRYYSASPALIDAVQEMLLKVGLAGSIHRKQKDRATLAVHVLSDRPRDYLTPHYPRRSVEWYDGYVYCVNVPNHVIHVRRKKKALWCGNCYDEAKRFAEAITMAYHRYHEVNSHIVRIFNSFGPRMRLDDGRVVPGFFGQALRGEPLTVFGDGSQTRSFCYVDDLVEGIERLLFADFHEPVNLGNPDETTILEFAKEILALSGSQSSIVYKPLPQDDPKVRKPDISRARKLLGWEPKVSRQDGLRRTLEYFRARIQGQSAT